MANSLHLGEACKAQRLEQADRMANTIEVETWDRFTAASTPRLRATIRRSLSKIPRFRHGFSARMRDCRFLRARTCGLHSARPWQFRRFRQPVWLCLTRPPRQTGVATAYEAVIAGAPKCRFQPDALRSALFEAEGVSGTCPASRVAAIMAGHAGAELCHG